MEEYISEIKKMNPTFKPKYVSRLIEKIYRAAVYEMINNRFADGFIKETRDPFLSSLAMTIP